MRLLMWMLIQSAFNFCGYPKKVLIILPYVEHLFWFGLVCTNSGKSNCQYRALLWQTCTWGFFRQVNLIPSAFFPLTCASLVTEIPGQCNPIRVENRIRKHLLFIYRSLANGINVPKVIRLSAVAYGTESVLPLM